MNEDATNVTVTASDANEEFASTAIDDNEDSKLQQGNCETAPMSMFIQADTTEEDNQTKRDIMAKQYGRSEISAVPGAVFATNGSNGRSNLKAKQSANGTLLPSAAHEASKPIQPIRGTKSSNVNPALQNLENAVISKVGSFPTSTVNSNASLKVNQIEALTKEEHRNNKREDSKKDEATTSAMYFTGDPNIKSNDVEYGMYSNDDTESGLAVALAIDELDEEYIDRPSAVEYDPDAKPPTYKNRRFRLYALLFLAIATIGTVGAALGIVLTNGNDVVPPAPIPYRATIGLQETLTQFLPEEYFDDVRNPYRKALDWITYTDPMAITPENPRFVQRFILAYFYFATSAKKLWTSNCAPSLSDSAPDTCKYEYIRSLRPIDDRLNRTGSRWLSNTDECDWAGLQCDGLSQISKIELGGMGITGTFPEGIVWLSSLRSIRIGFDELEGPLPDYLANMKHLIEVALPGNKLTGTIPDTWFESRMINVVNVEDNQITGTISEGITNRIDLQELIIRDNNFTGTIPNDLGSNCINMVNLRMDGNSFNGTFPSTLGKMEHITIFDISNNVITGTIPEEIGNWAAIGEFFVSNNLLTGTVPERFWDAEKLILIDMSNNKLSGTISGKIAKMYDLTSISIANNQFTGQFPARLGQTYVQYIYASGNQFNGTVAAQLCDLVSEGQLIDLVFDCAVPIGADAVPEIICPEECCSLCCNPDGDNCAKPF